MYVKINRNVCDHQLPICERCLGRFLANPLGYERQCFEEIRDDGSELLTLDIHTGDSDIHLELDEDQRRMMGAEGWATFLEMGVPMYRNKKDRPE